MEVDGLDIGWLILYVRICDENFQEREYEKNIEAYFHSITGGSPERMLSQHIFTGWG